MEGTVLAMMALPVGITAALRYWHSGNVKLSVVIFLALGFLMGGFIGAHFAQHIPELILRRLFGLVILLVSIKMIIGK